MVNALRTAAERSLIANMQSTFLRSTISFPVCMMSACSYLPFHGLRTREGLIQPYGDCRFVLAISQIGRHRGCSSHSSRFLGWGASVGLKRRKASSVAVGLNCTQVDPGDAVICPHIPSAEVRQEISADRWVAGKWAFMQSGHPGEGISPREGAQGPEARERAGEPCMRSPEPHSRRCFPLPSVYP